jgi:hypothetical protein
MSNLGFRAADFRFQIELHGNNRLLEFVAIGPNPDQRWRRPLPEGQVIRLGRAPLQGWSVPWDLRISREHVDLKLVGGRLEVRCLETARNPAYRLGEAQRQFTIGAGEDFRIGGTTFRIDRVSGDAPTCTAPTGSAPTSTAPSSSAPASAESAAGPPRGTSEVEELKAQVAALQMQIAAQAEARRHESEAARLRPDSEVELLRAQVEALKTQVATQRRPADEKDRQIADLKARLAALQGGEQTTPAGEQSAASPPAAGSAPPAASPRAAQSPAPQPPAAAEPASRAAGRPDVEALKARLEAQAAAKRQTRQELGDDPYHDPLPPTPAPATAMARLEFVTPVAPPDEVSARPARDNGAHRGERKSTLFVLKAQIEAQAAKLRRSGKRGAAKATDSRQSDVEALKALLEARAAERDKARRSPSFPSKSSSGIRSSHITALLALHEARGAAREMAGRAEREAAGGDDDTDEVVLIEAADDEHKDPGPAEPLPRRIWRLLPRDVQEAARAMASGLVSDEAVKARLVAALNQLLITREFLTDAELHAALNAVAGGGQTSSRRSWTEGELRRAARHALARVLPGLARKAAPACSVPAARLLRGKSFGGSETLNADPHGATYVAAPAPPGCMLPVELVRIDAGTLAELRESSAEFRAAAAGNSAPARPPKAHS